MTNEPHTTRSGLQSLALAHGRSMELERLGEGMDFITYRSDDLVFRVPKRIEVANLVEAEYALLSSLPADLPLAVPRPLRAPIIPTGAEHPVLVYPLVNGTPLGDIDDPVDVATLGASLGAFLRRLHALPVMEVAPSNGLLPEPDELTRELESVKEHIGNELVRVATVALTQPQRRIDAVHVMCHRDLTEDHVLVDTATGETCGVIDFGDAGPSPWWHDLVGIWMWGGDEALDATCAGYGRDLTHDERQLLEHHALFVAAWDVIHALREEEASQDLADELETSDESWQGPRSSRLVLLGSTKSSTSRGTHL